MFYVGCCGKIGIRVTQTFFTSRFQLYQYHGGAVPSQGAYRLPALQLELYKQT